MGKKLLKGVLGFMLPSFLAYIAAGYGKPAITWGVFIVGYLISIIIFRANVLMFIGVRVYNSNKQKGLKIIGLSYKTGKMDPANQLIYAYLILREGRLDEAETIINKATVIGKHTLTDQQLRASDFNRALITWKRGDISAAIVQLEDLYEIGYKSPAFYGSLGSFYLLNKEFDKALELAKEGVEYNSTDNISCDNLGQAYIELGMLDEAEKVYEELIPRNPNFLEAYYNYATVQEKRGNLEEAKKYYEIALTYDEKFLSIVSHDTICEALERVEALIV